MMPLGVGVAKVRAANALHLVQQGAIGKNRAAQLGPIAPLTAGNYVVNGCEGEALMVEVAMKHGVNRIL
jgi:hypothetical protein